MNRRVEVIDALSGHERGITAKDGVGDVVGWNFDATSREREDAVDVSRAPTSRVSRVSRERLARVGASASVSNVGFERAVATHGAFVRLARVGELAFEFSSMSPRRRQFVPPSIV